MIEPLSVVAGVMVVGLIVCGPIIAAEGVPRSLHGEAWLWLALAGAGNVAGLFVNYVAYRHGQVAVIVPIVSTEGAVAALIAVLAGESIGAVAGAALLLAAAGVCLTAIPPGTPSVRASGLHLFTVGLAALAALVFGLSLYATGRASALLPSAWVVISARVVGTAVLALPLALRGRLRITRRAAPLVLASGLAEVVGFFSYTLGTRHGIAIAAVLGSQFAAIAVAGAYILFKERLTRIQLTGICTILLGVSLLSAFS